MANHTCSLEGCDTKHFGLGYCQNHHRRFKKYGDPLAGGTHYKTPEESFAARTKLDPETGCLVWTGGTNEVYGVICVGCGDDQYVHRYAWERVNGPLPSGMMPDHTCHNKLCANIDHLRLSTKRENAQNVIGPRADNTSGYLGVGWDKSRGKWLAYASLGQKMKNLGRYNTAEEAAEVSRLFRLEHYTHNDHDRAA